MRQTPCRRKVELQKHRTNGMGRIWRHLTYRPFIGPRRVVGHVRLRRDAVTRLHRTVALRSIVSKRRKATGSYGKQAMPNAEGSQLAPMLAPISGDQGQFGTVADKTTASTAAHGVAENASREGELPTIRRCVSKSGRRDSNSQRPAWKAGALPLSYTRAKASIVLDLVRWIIRRLRGFRKRKTTCRD